MFGTGSSGGSSQGARFNRGPASEVSSNQQPHNVNSELHAVRKELVSMHRDIAREKETEAVQASVESEISALYHELQRAAAKLESERSSRRRVEAELEAIRIQKTRDTAAIAEDLETKRMELHQLRDERSNLKEWLDRGVHECRRVAGEVTQLKEALEISEAFVSALDTQKSDLTHEIQNLTADLHNVQKNLKTAQHEKSLLQIRADETAGALNQAEASRKVTQKDADRIGSEMVRLSQRVRGLEDAELCLHSLTSCMSELVSEISTLHVAVTRGTLDDVFSKPPHAADALPATEPLRLGEEIVETKLNLQRLQDAVGKLRKAVKQFVADRVRQQSDIERAHQDELAHLHNEKEVQIHRYNCEKDALRRRVEDLEREILNVAAGTQVNTEKEANMRLERLAELLKTNELLKAENVNLKDETTRLRTKCQKMKVDWSKVEESRRRFHQLQTEVQLMQEYYDKLALENRNLKLLVNSDEDGAAQRGATDEASFLTASSPLHKQAFDQWKYLHSAGQ